jgi:hypothetical protein
MNGRFPATQRRMRLPVPGSPSAPHCAAGEARHKPWKHRWAGAATPTQRNITRPQEKPRRASDVFYGSNPYRKDNRSLSLSDSEHHAEGTRERSSCAWSGGRPRRPVAVFRHCAVAAAKPSGNPPSLARLRRRGAQGVALTPGSVRSRRCHTCPSAHPRAFSAHHHDTTRTQYRVRKLTI